MLRKKNLDDISMLLWFKVIVRKVSENFCQSKLICIKSSRDLKQAEISVDFQSGRDLIAIYLELVMW